MAVRLTGAGESHWRPDRSAVEMVTLPLGRVTISWLAPGANGWARQNADAGQGYPVALGRANKLGSDVIEGMLMAVMKCLRSWAPVSKRMRRH